MLPLHHGGWHPHPPTLRHRACRRPGGRSWLARRVRPRRPSGRSATSCCRARPMMPPCGSVAARWSCGAVDVLLLGAGGGGTGATGVIRVARRRPGPDAPARPPVVRPARLSTAPSVPGEEHRVFAEPATSGQTYSLPCVRPTRWTIRKTLPKCDENGATRTSVTGGRAGDGCVED